jgi:hypothetical protein
MMREEFDAFSKEAKATGLRLEVYTDTLNAISLRRIADALGERMFEIRAPEKPPMPVRLTKEVVKILDQFSGGARVVDDEYRTVTGICPSPDVAGRVLVEIEQDDVELYLVDPKDLKVDEKPEGS